ncbi:hypothetical protein COLO4_02182 [Corchorus olitorius]|uniref:Uncharacterized protein n=1 Tax=Corchorus olitorius TaxID=93759 RepID=A0A1R3L1D1_9ROSI|nr:hypothetical protein COLO4_02182 [Corchorus olitorius]
MALGVFEEALEAHQATGATDQPAMQTDGKHLGRGGAFFVEGVEGVLEVLEELLGGVEALDLGESHVVGVQGVGDHQVWPAGGRIGFPIGQVVVVGVAVVEEAAFLHHQAPGIGPGSAGVPAQRSFAGQFGEDLDGALQMDALLGFVHVLVVDPAIAVAADLVAGLDHGADDLGVALGGHGHGKDGQGHLVPGEQFQDAPDAGATAVFVERLHGHVADARQRLGGDHLGKKGLGLLVAVEDVALATLFVIEHEGQGDAGVTRPAGVGRLGAIADEITGIGHGRGILAVEMFCIQCLETFAESQQESCLTGLTGLKTFGRLERARAADSASGRAVYNRWLKNC